MSVAVMGACSSSGGSSNGGGTGGAAATGGSTGTGGSSGGATGTGGSSGGGTGLDPVYVCLNKPPADPGGTGVAGDACCSETYGTGTLPLGSCVTAASITDTKLLNAYGHLTCSASPDLRCAPTQTAINLASTDAGVATGVFGTCRMTTGGLDLEGRCIPKCFVAGNPLASFLTQGTCSATLNQVCAPCFNPVDGTATGACTTKPGDAAVDPAPTAFAKCTGTSTPTDPLAGTCVPSALAAASGNSAVSSLQQKDCANTGDICVPTLKVQNLNACFPKCDTNSTVQALGAQYKPGACLPAFAVAEVSPQGASILTQETCQTGEQCAPCLNPLSTPTAGAPTGACE